MAKKVIVAVHGIGDQFRYQTVQATANQFCRYFDKPEAIPLGKFHSSLYVEGSEIPFHIQTLRETLKEIIDQLRQGFKISPPPGGPGTPIPAALVLQSPGPELPAELGFAEVYWADVPRQPAKDEHILEEAKRWAHTVVERVRLLYQPTVSGVTLEPANYAMAATVIEEMIETVVVLERLLFLAEKAGVLKFDLKKVLVDYLGDVQIVAEYGHYRTKILDLFDRVMADIYAGHERDQQRAADLAVARGVAFQKTELEIHIVAHSEGTVITFLGLLRALSKTDALGCSDPPKWVNHVRGLMTIGSPINKHLVLWPELWTNYLKPRGPLPPERIRPDQDRIRWWNYYDYGDPIGFNLKTTRKWLRDEGWDQAFHFPEDQDAGFTRYPFPGQAHNDYWDDPGVFGHFIQHVVKPQDAAGREVPPSPPKKYAQPTSKWWCFLLSPFTPYFLMAVLCYLGVYLLYIGVENYLHPAPATPEAKKAEADARDKGGEQALHIRKVPDHTWVRLGNVAGLTALLASLMVAARIPRLTLLRYWWAVGWALFLLACGSYILIVDPDTRAELGGGSWASTLLADFDKVAKATVGVLLAAALWGLLEPYVGKRFPKAGSLVFLLLGTLLLVIGVVGLWYYGGDWAQLLPGLPFAWDKLTKATAGVLLTATLLILVVPQLSKRLPPKWGGTRLLVFLGGVAIFLLVFDMISQDYYLHHVHRITPQRGPLWPLLLAGAGFLYLWWLSALVFDLAFVWHRYIRFSVIEDRLGQLQRK